MPLTLAHPAAVLPLRRLLPALPLSALVAGSMAPDVEYLLRLAPRGTFGHSPAGLLLFCVPAGLVLWLAWTRLVSPALQGTGDAGRAPLLHAAAAILLGAATHVAWDAFTHATGAGVRLVPALLDPTPFLGWPGYRVLQHASTLFGGIVVLLAALPPVLRVLRNGGTEMRTRVVSALASTAGGGAIVGLVAALPVLDARFAVLGMALGLTAWAAATRIRGS